MINQKKVDDVRKTLEEERAKLLQGLKAAEQPKDYGGDVQDEAEEADEAEEFATGLAKGQGLRERISEIDTVLSKIDNGTYGLCESCNAQIPESDMEAMPETKLCAKCRK